MTVNCFKDFEDDYIVFSFNGDILLNNISDIPEQIVSTLNEYTTRKILIDFTSMKSEFYLLDFIKIVRTIHKEFNSIRIAIVDNSKEIKDSETIEAILFNNGIILRILKSTDDAKKWLSN